MTAFPEDADSLAMLRLREGEDLALNEIMERWQRRVTSYLLRLTRSETVAVDLAQETFVRVYQSRTRYRPEAKIFDLALRYRIQSGSRAFSVVEEASNRFPERS